MNISQLGNGEKFSSHYPQNNSFHKPPLQAWSVTMDPPSEFRYSVIGFFYQEIKANRTIASYRKYYCLCSLDRSLRVLPPLVFTVTAFEISLFQGPERQYQSFEKAQVSIIFQGLTCHPQKPQLNDSLASLVRIR